jgi:rhamnose utilization protein RhaD (predicted bifunctional aldolase and dehydrogenase)
MPGFILAQKIYEMTQGDFDWESCEGIILLNHGIFTFDDDAKRSYDKMIDAVSLAEEFLVENAAVDLPALEGNDEIDLETLKEVISETKGYEVVMKLNQSPLAKYYASQNDLTDFATRGVLTPEHIIRTKRIPLVLEDENIEDAVQVYMNNYKKYFQTFASDEICLNPAPNYAIVKNVGVVLFGKTEKECSILNDVIEHTMMAVLRADKLGGYESISISDSFDMEYWELEQAKLK